MGGAQGSHPNIVLAVLGLSEVCQRAIVRDVLGSWDDIYCVVRRSQNLSLSVIVNEPGENPSA